MINKIFGIGLSKTGTTSLNQALCQLGIKAIHGPRDATTISELMEARYQLTILNTYQAITDIEVAPFYPQLDKEYPGSKFILTVREKEAWLKSAEHYWLWGGHVRGSPTLQTFSYSKYLKACVYGCYVFDRDRFSYVYDLHLKTALSYFATRPDDLLVLDICGGAGWEPLCKFLEMPVPAAPFPHENKWPRDSHATLPTFSARPGNKGQLD